MASDPLFDIGQFVLLDGLPAVVVGLPNGAGTGAPDEHVALWFGEPRVQRLSQGDPGTAVPEVWIVPLDQCQPCPRPAVKH